MKIAINIKLKLLTQINSCSLCDLTVDVRYKNLDNNDVSIKSDGDRFDIKLGNLALYSIFPQKNAMSCIATNYESFFSTFFNIPFSVYFLCCKQEVLFHACSVLCNEELTCLTGDKGVGKSTLMSILDKMDDFEVFSDDTLRIDKMSYGSKAHNLAKQLPDTIKALNLSTLSEKNVAGKSYIRFPYTVGRAKIKNIIQLKRTKKYDFGLKKITTDMKKNSIFKTNVVGVSHMSHQLIFNILKLNLVSNIEFYELYIPDDLNFIVSNTEKLNDMLLNAVLNGDADV